MKNYSLNGVAQVVQIGKNGPHLIGQAPTIVAVQNNSQTALARLRCLDSVNTDEALTMGQYLNSGGVVKNYDFFGVGTVNTNDFLKSNSIPSNVTGGFISETNITLKKIIINTALDSTFDVEIYSHDGNAVNLTLLDAVSMTASKSGVFTISEAVALNKQIALKVVNGSGANISARLVGQGVI